MVNLRLVAPSHHKAGDTNKQHLIANVEYVHNVPGELAPLECTCGWKGQGFEFQPHRKEAGVTCIRTTGIIKVEGI